MVQFMLKEGSHRDDPIRRCSLYEGLTEPIRVQCDLTRQYENLRHFRLRLVLNHPGGSESIKPILLGH